MKTKKMKFHLLILLYGSLTLCGCGKSSGEHASGNGVENPVSKTIPIAPEKVKSPPECQLPNLQKFAVILSENCGSKMALKDQKRFFYALLDLSREVKLPPQFIVLQSWSVQFKEMSAPVLECLKQRICKEDT